MANPASGRYGGVGKQLALVQLRGMISRIVYDFNLSFVAEGNEVSFDVDSKDTFTFTIGHLHLVFTERARE